MNDKANYLGEWHRDNAFVKVKRDDYGCYSTFLVHRDYTKINNSTSEGHELIKSVAILMDCDYDDVKNNVYVNLETATLLAWYWDGDGTLLFTTPKYSVINTDCKKSDRWEFI